MCVYLNTSVLSVGVNHTELMLVKIARREVLLSKEGVKMRSARSIKELSHYLHVAGDAAQDDVFIVLI